MLGCRGEGHVNAHGVFCLNGDAATAKKVTAETRERAMRLLTFGMPPKQWAKAQTFSVQPAWTRLGRVRRVEEVENAPRATGQMDRGIREQVRHSNSPCPEREALLARARQAEAGGPHQSMHVDCSIDEQ